MPSSTIFSKPLSTRQLYQCKIHWYKSINFARKALTEPFICQLFSKSLHLPQPSRWLTSRHPTTVPYTSLSSKHINWSLYTWPFLHRSMTFSVVNAEYSWIDVKYTTLYIDTDPPLKYIVHHLLYFDTIQPLKNISYSCYDKYTLLICYCSH